jgi:hypothetical protein
MTQTIQGEYERREAAATGQYGRLKSRGVGVRLAVAVLGFMAARSLWLLWGRHGSWLVFAADAGAALVALGYVMWLLEREQTAWRTAVFYREGMDRLRGERASPQRTGEAFITAGHLYERDLNVLGKDSLFSLLATTRTSMGQQGLARLLLEPADAATARSRQQAVRELAGMLDLRERIALLGSFLFRDVSLERFEEWLGEEAPAYPVWVRGVLAGCVVGWLGLLIFGGKLRLDEDVLHGLEIALFAAQCGVCRWLQTRVRDDLARVLRIAGQTEILRAGMRLLQDVPFQSERLMELKRDAAGGDKALATLQRYLVVVEQRAKEYVYPFGLLLCAGTQAAIGLDRWRRRFDGPMRRWMAAWAEFEGMVALAAYAAEHEENVYPEMVDGAVPVLEAEGMVHPLIARDTAVANDVALGGEVRFLLISGSNMAGKSTLLRALGVNVVLGMAGAPVPVGRMRMSALRVGASLALTDSLAEGKSKFLAEVERLRDLLQGARAWPGETLFLIDEIFSGTNSADRRAAAEAVVRGLVAAGAVGALSTHDLALAELADTDELGGRNVHMASPDESDPLGFDYKLKAGVNRTTNALAIVRLLGLG